MHCILLNKCPFVARVPRLNLRQVVEREEDERPDYTLMFDDAQGAQGSSRFADIACNLF